MKRLSISRRRWFLEKTGDTSMFKRAQAYLRLEACKLGKAFSHVKQILAERADVFTPRHSPFFSLASFSRKGWQCGWGHCFKTHCDVSCSMSGAEYSLFINNMSLRPLQTTLRFPVCHLFQLPCWWFIVALSIKPVAVCQCVIFLIKAYMPLRFTMGLIWGLEKVHNFDTKYFA